MNKHFGAGVALAAVLLLCGSSIALAQLDPIAEPNEPAMDTAPAEETVAPTDTDGPVISDIATASAGVTDATIMWSTDELATSEFRYGTTEVVGNTAMLGTEASLMHAATITGLLPGTTYHFCIDATDLADNTTISCGHTFTTEAEAVEEGDTNPPEILSIEVSSVSHTEATISWTTDEPTDGQIEYGTSVNYGSFSEIYGTFSTKHSITLSNLDPNTEYHYRIRTRDEAGNETVSFDETFTTGTTPGDEPIQNDATQNDSADIPAVQFSFIEVAYIDTDTATITWITDVPSDSQVAYGNTVLLGSITTVNSELVTEHSVTLENLESGTNYVFRVRSKPEGAEEFTRSGEYEFNTLPEDIVIDSEPDELIKEEEAEVGSGPSTGETMDEEEDTSTRRSSSGGRSSSRRTRETIEIEPVLPVYHFAEHYVQGDKDMEIEHLQQLLIKEEVYPERLVTGYFGPLTEAALFRFQEKYNLPNTGEVSPYTRAKLNVIAQTQVRPIAPVHSIVLESDVELGNTGEAVTRLQKYLVREGSYERGLITGYFGTLTHEAVKIFQSKHHIQPVSGYVGEKTRHVMETLSGF